MHVGCHAIVASDELNMLSVITLIYLIFSSNHEYHKHSQHQLQMGPKEPGDSYSGSGKAAGAFGYPGNVCFICDALIGNDLKKNEKKTNSFFSLNQKQVVYPK